MYSLQPIPRLGPAELYFLSCKRPWIWMKRNGSVAETQALLDMVLGNPLQKPVRISIGWEGSSIPEKLRPGSPELSCCFPF